MSLSALAKFFLPPAIASAAVFSAMTAPLAIVGDQQINIQFKQEPLFFGKLRDVALPYVVVATGISMGAGLAAAAVCGWRNSAVKSAQIEEELSKIEENLQVKEELIKEFQLSESRLQISGLSSFLNEQIPLDKTVSTSSLNTDALAQAQSHQQHNKEAVVANAASAFASAQNFLGYSQPNTGFVVNQNAISSTDIEELQRQLREMMLQMQAMQHNLQIAPQVRTAQQPAAPNKFSVFYEAPNTQEVQVA